jgi:hypothetical protein
VSVALRKPIGFQLCHPGRVGQSREPCLLLCMAPLLLHQSLEGSLTAYRDQEWCNFYEGVQVKTKIDYESKRTIVKPRARRPPDVDRLETGTRRLKVSVVEGGAGLARWPLEVLPVRSGSMVASSPSSPSVGQSIGTRGEVVGTPPCRQTILECCDCEKHPATWLILT